MSTLLRSRVAPSVFSVAALIWLAYATLIAVLVTAYILVLTHGSGIGVDYACFRAASLLLAHGGNPYDVMQLWREENLLYNVPRHLHPGSLGYYPFDEYRNPPLFATVLTPLARMPFTQGFALYSATVVLLAAAGVWLTLRALGWTTHRLPAMGITLALPCVFLAVWNGQQSTLLLCAMGAGLCALRGTSSGTSGTQQPSAAEEPSNPALPHLLLRLSGPGLAGALFALGWIKPHLLLPVALAAALLLARRDALRCYGGFALATALGVALTVAAGSGDLIVAWLRGLAGYTGYAHVTGEASVDAIQTYLPSLSGMGLVLLPQPWNRLVAGAATLLGLGVMALLIARARRRGTAPWEVICVLAATWLLFAPYVHAHDEVLLLPALALAWRVRAGGAASGRSSSAAAVASQQSAPGGQRPGVRRPLEAVHQTVACVTHNSDEIDTGTAGVPLPGGFNRRLPMAALWALTTLTLAFVLPRPWIALGVVPPLLTVVAALRVQGEL